MKNPSRTIIAFILIDIVLVLAVAGGYWWLKREEGKLLESAKALIAAERKKENLERFLRIYGQTEEGRRAVAANFVSIDSLPAFIERLERAATDTGVTYRLSDTKPSDRGERQVLDLTIASEGTFEQVYRFIITLENLPYRLDINQAYLGPVAAGRWRANLDLTLLSYE